MGAGNAAQKTETGPSKATVLIFIWASATLFWSIFTEPHRTFAARVLLFQPLWIVRIFTGDLTWDQDLGLFLALHYVYSFWSGAWSLPTIEDVKRYDMRDDVVQVYLQIFALLGVCGFFAGGIVRRGHQLKHHEPSGPFREQSIEDAILPPLLITSRTTHSRLFPQKHSFSYSYLFAGVPVGLQGKVSNVLSVDSRTPAWFDVRSKDYLDRGNDSAGLGEKLKRYLHAQGVTDRDYAFAYFVTAPRFLSYSFNPVSFWYLYDSDTHLKYMILEVNNTFDERRMYLLKIESSKDASSDITDDRSGESSNMLVFTDTWDKDFHVSPFNSRKGSYSLRAVDPLTAFQETGNVKIDNTIVLRSSKEHPKVVARVYSEGTPKDPTTVTAFQLTKFILAWWWVGLATFPRIVWEARKLFFRRKLHVWFRPEVTNTSIGRPYSDDEKSLEEFLRSFLTDAVESAREPLRVIYEPPHHDSGEIVLYSPGFTYEEAHSRTLTIKVLSPAFYSRFIHYAHAKEAFDRECLTTDEKNRTVALDGSHALPALLNALKQNISNVKQRSSKSGYLSEVRWNVLRRLRCPPAAASYPSDESRLDHEYIVQDIRAFHLSELDKYVRQTHTNSDEYRRIAIKLFMAERLAFGLPALVAMCDWIIRSVLILFPMAFSERAKAFDVLRLRTFVKADLAKTAILLLLANAVHLWSFIKG
ncbi:hypothetical protein M409DRAFT_64903 [Zasmidium cellare ATCC 36951]|uniref:DUF1365-domain-containing protein n=1 Tax=Zasmidium cellare ATCC 36951 TaxID=1080233 RepID=A0A6A6CPY7_ZASCE|nr:uncharacterized protein M409DRAFT_64903 [Zasmidium cellare ATCC 36951]KAF2169131.1 hypothetical protein M409DRAFT_64903 [Zasmidium cellare ATCC 36951]